jgi:hypothetical protein
MTATVVAHRGADVGRNPAQVPQQPLDRHPVEFGTVAQGDVQSLDVGAMVHVVMDAQRARIEIRFELVRSIGQLGESERIGLVWHEVHP